MNKILILIYCKFSKWRSCVINGCGFDQFIEIFPNV